jgi:hypothetical protein
MVPTCERSEGLKVDGSGITPRFQDGNSLDGNSPVRLDGESRPRRIPFYRYPCEHRFPNDRKDINAKEIMIEWNKM